MFKCILVATDGSTHADKAVKLATDLASKYRTQLVLMHVHLSDASSETLRKLANRKAMTKEQRDLLDNYEVEGYEMLARAGDIATFTIPAPLKLLEVVGRQVLERAAAKVKKAGLARVSTVIASGDAADAILATAKKRKADLIILGSRGLGALKGIFLGSVSHKVSARAKCTCITVK